MFVSTGVTCNLAIVLVCACAASGQFTFKGFPLAVNGSTHKVTCSYPGASSYTWRFPGGSYYGAVNTFTAGVNKHDGVWHCDAVVNGVTKTESVNLLTYCNGVYITSATTTNPTIGDSKGLNCKVISPTGEQVLWSFTAPASIDNGVAAVTESGCGYYHKENDNIRFTPPTICKPSTSNQFFNLRIKKVSASHEGYWRCYDFGKSGCYSKPVRIAIARPPKESPTLTGFDNPILGTIHNLTCDAWQPFVRPLTYNWYKDGVQISSGNESTWRLQPVKKEANGKYKCEVVDKVKNLKAEAEDILTVYYVASWNPAVEQKKRNQVWIGQSVNLTLNIEAYPLPTSIEWFTGNGNLTRPLNVTTTKISDTTWILSVSYVQEIDYGNYTANVTNAAGSSFFRFEILPACPPEAPSDLKALKLKDAHALAVTFTAGSDGGAPQNFTIEYNVKGETKIETIVGIKDPVNTKTVTQEICNLRSGTIYQIKVMAINGVGRSSYSNVIEAKTDANVVPVWQIETPTIVIPVVGVVVAAVVAVVVVVVMKRRKIACFAGQGDITRAPVLDDRTVTDFVGGDAVVHVTNRAFEGAEPEYVNKPRQITGEPEPVYVNQPLQGRDAEPEYVNQPRQMRDSDADAYEDMSTPCNPYADLNMTTRAGVEEQPYETLKIA